MDVSYLATLGKERLIALLLADRLTAPALVAPKLEAAEVGAVKRETADDAALPITPLHTHHPPPVDTPTPVHHPPPVDTHHPPPLDLEDSFKDAQSWPHDSLDISSTQPRNDAFYDDTMVPVTPKAAACDSYVDTLVMSPGESTKLSPEPGMSEISTFSMMNLVSFLMSFKEFHRLHLRHLVLRNSDPKKSDSSFRHVFRKS